MRLADRFFGVRICLRSPLSKRTLAERINAAASHWFNPFADGVFGGVHFDLLLLGVSGGIIDYRGKPILTGRVSEAGDGSELALRFGVSLKAIALFVFWLILGLIAFPGEIDVAPLLVIMGLSFGALAFGARRVPNDLHEILLFLEEHAEASPINDSPLSQK